jgi:ketosteroid isomerase-like protein
MKNFILLILILSATASFGQSKDELEIRRLENHWTQLLDKSDTTALLKLWTKDYVVNNVNGKIVTAKDIIALIRKGQTFPPVERIIEKITFTSNLAIVMGKEIAQPVKTAQSEGQTVTRRFTNIWIKSKDGWQLTARQATNILVQ